MVTNIAKPYKISVIAAVGRNRELGYKNKLLWSMPGDMQRFKTLTAGHPVIMGLNTFRSIGQPLRNRTNIVMSLEPVEIEGATVVTNIEDAISKASTASGGEEIFVIGGGQIYTLFMSVADKLYLTTIDAEAEADAFFPDYSMFTKKISEENFEHEGIKYSFVELER